MEPTDAHEFVTLDEYLKRQGIVGLCGIDTRALTRHIRDHGVMNGMILDNLENREDRLQQMRDYRVPPAVGKITVNKPQRFVAENARFELAVPDYGFRRSILDFLLSRGCSVTIYPAYTPTKELLASGADGFVLSDGPGDPGQSGNSWRLSGSLPKRTKPIFRLGIGSSANGRGHGYRIEKLPVGHRGSNQPVRNLDNGRVMVTEQNHGYTVALDSLDDEAEAFLRNVNDGTVEGLRYKNHPILTVQFEPADGNGYQDTAWVFDAVAAMLENR